MKKLFVAIIACMVLLTGCTKKEYLSEVKDTEIIDKLEKDESFVVYIGMNQCSACVAFKPIVKELANSNKYPVYSVMLDDEKNANTDELIALLPIEYTPTTFVIVDGEIVASEVGKMSYSQLKEFINTNAGKELK